MSEIDRRGLLKVLAAVPLLAPAMLRAQDMSRIAIAPIQVRDRRVWMPVRFGDGEQQHFILDSGAFSHLISDGLAERLGLRRIGALRGSGIGGRTNFPAFRAPDVIIGEVRVGSMTFAAYPNEIVIHPNAGGALSAGLLTVADTDVDFDAGLWRLHLDGRSDRTGFERLPSSIRSDGPGSGAAEILVDMDIDGQSYRLKVDTGAPADIMLRPTASARTGLWNDSTPFAPGRQMGLGGDGGRARLVRMQAASLGGIRFERPLVSLTDPRERNDADNDGLLGIGLIERLNLSTEVRARRLWAKRNAQRARPERYGMTGFWLEQRRDGLEIVELSPRSPAADAGLMRGDQVLGGTLAEWIRRFGGRPGQAIEIPYRRGGETRMTTLTLREFL